MNKKLFLSSLSLAALVLAGCGENYGPTPGPGPGPGPDPEPVVYESAEELANAAFACLPEANLLSDVALDSDDGSYWFAAGYDAEDGVTTALAGYTKGAEAIKGLGLTYGTPDTEDGEYYVEFTYSEEIGGSVYVYEYDETPGLFVFQFAAVEEGETPPETEEHWYDLYLLFGYEYAEEGMDKDLINTSLGTTGIEFPVVNSEAVYGVFTDEETEEAYGISYIVKVEEDVSKAYATEIQPLLAVLNAEEDEDAVSYLGYDAEHSFVVQFSCAESFFGEWLEFRVEFVVFDAVYTDKLTEDVQWNDATAAYLESIGVTLPFVQMGDDYVFTAEYLEDYGCYSIYDSYYLNLTADWTFDGYTLDEDATSDYYGCFVKVTEDGYTYILDAYWHNGNWIDIYIVEPVVYVTATLVTDISQLTDGCQIVFGASAAGVVSGKASGKFITAADATFDNGVATFNEADVSPITLSINEGEKVTYSFTIDEELIGTKAAKAFVFDDSSATSTWTISIDADSGNAVVASTNSNYGSIQYNAASPRFVNYTSNQTAIQIYLINPIIE